ncbi:hypothetical protein COU37_05405 [Candidatus Micrarchaeota archaeon CG10_big_fil_rev_8_21_14_0_10_45_29]|nr:MAG: hypothetical protein COU37_05405 [Candidatus Micrarchaeota archaeon CG10_big_fil_rev_8_21_14_0_10_45_29]
MELTSADKKILALLDCNARMPLSEVGKRARIAKETVKYRISKMQKAGILRGFYAIVDHSKLGLASARIYFRLKDFGEGDEKKLAEFMLKDPHCWGLFQTSGPHHMVAVIKAKDAWEMGEFAESIRKNFWKIIEYAQISIFCQYCELTSSFLHGGEKKEFCLFERQKQARLDGADMKILGALSQDARLPIISLAKKAGISPATARAKLRRLVKEKVIVAFRPFIDTEALGYEYFKVDVSVNDYVGVQKVANYAKSLPNTTMFQKMLFSPVVEFDLQAKNFAEFVKIMDSIKEKFPSLVRNYSYYSRVKFFAISYLK